MKKMLLLGAALMALSFVPANAAPGNGCSASGGATNVATTCSYVASGGGTYAAATPNSWTITVPDRNSDGQPEVLASSDSAQLPSSGSLASLAGETVTVTMGPDCVPGDVVCGSIGSVTAGETA